MIQTSSVLHPGTPDEEVFDAKDKKELREFVDVAASDYDQRIPEAEQKVHELKRQLVRAEHELKRLLNHRRALTTFSDKHELTKEGN